MATDDTSSMCSDELCRRIGKSAPLQPSLILWPCCCSNLCLCNTALQMLIHLSLIKCVLMNISLFLRKSSIDRSFLEHVLEGPTQATGKYSLIQPCHSGLKILFNFTNMNTEGCTGWCRWVTSESLGLETVQWGMGLDTVAQGSSASLPCCIAWRQKVPSSGRGSTTHIEPSGKQ